ncbi:NUDIX hydrolase [uncultured Ilyobacter sp.]|jgi:ADP-ribose pyrophosphatase|uniref:NUDIX hydrolase n=1 Tax=uncultured Ilyobacter sp. TaxID=544433 RepID=UPI0029C035FA|nr:NUDIX hydrolase [uncultured Ilyobacter sp.]
MKFKHIDKKVVYKNDHFEISQEKLVLPGGKEVWWSFIEGVDAVGILALTDDNKVILVKQYRPAVQDFVLEIPAGLIEPGESPEETAYRELEEEAGYRAKSMEKIYEYYSSPGISKSKTHIFLAKSLVKTKQSLDEDEFLEIIEASFEELQDLNLVDGKSILAMKHLEILGTPSPVE